MACDPLSFLSSFSLLFPRHRIIRSQKRKKREGRERDLINLIHDLVILSIIENTPKFHPTAILAILTKGRTITSRTCPLSWLWTIERLQGYLQPIPIAARAVSIVVEILKQPALALSELGDPRSVRCNQD